MWQILGKCTLLPQFCAKVYDNVGGKPIHTYMFGFATNTSTIKRVL